MNTEHLQHYLEHFRMRSAGASATERLKTAKLLMDAARHSLRQAQASLHEAAGTAARSNAQRRETEAEPKSPLHPVSVAEPTKPKKPKYSGNHAPSAPRR